MSYKLEKPYTDKDYADFAVKANENGQRTEQDEVAIYALYPTEILQDGEIIDISDTQEYKDKIAQERKGIKKRELQKQIEELDIKRIRAIAEPTQKDENTTWLEFYTSQIQDLRKQITEL